MRSRSLAFLLVLLLTAGGAVPLFGDSVFVSNSTPNGSQYPGITIDGTPVPYCQQLSTSSATCASSFSGHGHGYGFIESGGVSLASAAFGALSGTVEESNGSSGRSVSSFGDDVIVTGGSGAGTLVSHYALAATAAATGGDGAVQFSFVQGATKTGVVPTFTNFGFTPPLPNPPPQGCQSYGLCFSEMFDVSSPIEFGTAVPLGALNSLNSDAFGEISVPGGSYAVDAGSSLHLTGYTVLDAGGNVVSAAAVTRQNVAGLDLFPTPEPATWGLMLAGLVATSWRLRRDRHRLGSVG